MKNGLRQRPSTEHSAKDKPETLKATFPKPTAVLVKMAEGSSYLDTVRLVKASGIDIGNLGAPIKDMRKTRSGDLIIELGGGIKANQAADSLGNQLSDKLSEQAGPVKRLTSIVEAEIVRIDVTADKDEVLRVVTEAIKGDGAAAVAEKAKIQITGLWEVRTGHQVTTLREPASVLRRVQKVLHRLDEMYANSQTPRTCTLLQMSRVWAHG